MLVVAQAGGTGQLLEQLARRVVAEPQPPIHLCLRPIPSSAPAQKLLPNEKTAARLETCKDSGAGGAFPISGKVWCPNQLTQPALVDQQGPRRGITAQG